MTPAVYGGVGMSGKGLGTTGLGGPQPAKSFALPAMSKTGRAFIAHLYDHNLVFKRTLGGATLISKPGLKLTQNAGYQPITLDITSPVTGITLGDVIRLTEQGDSTGAILFTGNVEEAPEEESPDSTSFQLSVVPWVSELGDTYFDKTYATPTEIAQFVRDAVDATSHLSVTPISCPDTGLMAAYDFQQTNALDAVHVAKQIAGANYFYFVDAEGVVWFQLADTTIPPTLTIRRGADYNSRKSSSTITGLRNVIPVIGGQDSGATDRITSLYNGTTSQALYGSRIFNPTPSYPTVTDQPTLDAIAASLGAQWDRVMKTAEIVLPALGLRLTPGRPGGVTVRYFEPAVGPASSPSGAGTYSDVLILQDVETDGVTQKILIGNVPYSDLDTQYEAFRVAQRVAVVAAPATKNIPVLPPAQNPPTVTIVGKFATSTGIFTEGGGIVTIGSASFTTPATGSGTAQVQGQVDARMEAWDNYVSAPRRSVRMVLSGGIYTGSWQELPFGLTRATYDGSSASGLALAASTAYTVSWQIDTVEYNQMHVFSGWGQVALTWTL